MDPIPPVSSPPGPRSAIRDARSEEAERLRNTAQEFEGMFLGMLMKAMRSTVGKGGLFKEGSDTQMYREMFDEEVGRAMAKAGGIGLAQMILREELRREAPGPEKSPQAAALDDR